MTAANLVSSQLAKRYDALPIAFVDERTLLVAMSDPANVLAIDDIAILTGFEVRAAVATSYDLAAVIARLTRFGDVVTTGGDEDDQQSRAAELLELHESADDAPVVKLVHQLVGQAVDAGASDLHIIPIGDELRVRFRIDGVLRDVTAVPRRMAPGVVSRIKIMAELDIAERRVPQDGRVGLAVDGHEVDLRVVSVPTVRGEGIVMRILDKQAVALDLKELGMEPGELTRFERAYHQPYGAVLVTGPTGSGKSTTLYAALQALNTTDKNIITIEDPVEYQIDGITQIQVNPKAGLLFDTGLRAMVRADPDIIMVGEIRDRETAKIATEAALTGHLVLSTLHTNDAATSITRLIEMGVEPFLVASAIDCVVAQRLVRVLCTHCKRKVTLPMATLREYGYAADTDIEGYEATGCKHCSGSGYRGRTGIYEVTAPMAARPGGKEPGSHRTEGMRGRSALTVVSSDGTTRGTRAAPAPTTLAEAGVARLPCCCLIGRGSRRPAGCGEPRLRLRLAHVGALRAHGLPTGWRLRRSVTRNVCLPLGAGSSRNSPLKMATSITRRWCGRTGGVVAPLR